MIERTDDAQSAALRAFLLLCALEERWQGKLVLVHGLDAEGRAMSVAASIAGAACFALESRLDVCRATLHAGACDFVVNSVDEALRILKNEIRKRKPVSSRFAEFGTRVVENVTAPALIDGYASAHQLALHEYRFTTPQELRGFDQRLVTVIPETDPRRRWALRAPGFFYRDRPYRRVAYLTAEEVMSLG